MSPVTSYPHLRLVLSVAVLSLPYAVRAEDKICTTRFGVTTCRTPTSVYIKLGIIGGILLLAGIGLLVYFLVRKRRQKELDAFVSEMEPSQIHGPPETTYHSPVPNISVMTQAYSPRGASVPYSASPYGMAHHPVEGGATLGPEHMMFAGPSGTPHYPSSAYGNIQHQQPQAAPLTRRRSTDDTRKLQGAYPFAGISSLTSRMVAVQDSPPSPAPVVLSSSPSYPEKG
ncbi:hypothetical protein EYR40_002305 [Pleurotus pulmonarius]|nr:hypothetical protein EYR36_002204 [Pleurotus pulmonarius]KAF4583812.1 hypothetical protein EYR40_002305 [Pleurotus pulmonarius]